MHCPLFAGLTHASQSLIFFALNFYVNSLKEKPVDTNSTLSDNELLTLLREGDHAAFTAIYHRYKRLLYKHAYQRLRNEAEADDIIH
ncbi:MAG: hypothetical protein V4577_04445, partial [Bacteroidota bacterium]